ncbi:amidohydrolase family protein [Ulvibacterium sp.]|uniref:amidohydrolase family protein n=1 Tax=Ulvibacterium sp. TaxID=2665914 RepID=UPI003CC6C227
MKRVRRFIRKLFRVIAIILLTFLLGLIIIILVSRKDYGNLESGIGQENKTLALTQVNIISMDQGREILEKHKTLLIDNGLITGILPDSVSIPSGYSVKSLDGKYVMPGLIDMHTHIFDRSDLAMYLGYGVTTVRNMMGFPMHLRWREQVNNSTYPGATLITASPTINSGANTGPFHKNIKTPQEGMEAVNAYKKKGYDFIKIYDGLDQQQFESIMQEADHLDMDVAGHPPHAIDLDVLLQYPITSFEHIEEVIQGMMDYKLDTVMGREIAKKLKQNGAKVTATLSPFHHIYKTTVEGEPFMNSIPKVPINPFIEFIGKKQLSQWIDSNEGTYKWHVDKYRCMQDLVRILNEEGVTLLLGTDTGPNLTAPGLTLHEEIALLHENSLSPYAIIKSGTIDAANTLGMQNEIGSVTKGKKSQLLILDDDPLTNLDTMRKPYAIINNTQWYDEGKIDGLRKLGSNKSGILMTLGRFLDHILSK